MGGTLAHLRVLISKTIEGKSIFKEGSAPQAEVLRDWSQMRNTGLFLVSDCPSRQQPAWFAKTDSSYDCSAHAHSELLVQDDKFSDTFEPTGPYAMHVTLIICLSKLWLSPG